MASALELAERHVNKELHVVAAFLCDDPAKVETMLAAMNAAHATKLPFPPRIPIRSPADDSHFKHLLEKYGDRFWEF